jgi:hypothetical protein
VLVNTGELQTHLLATSKGKSFHRMRQQTGKPLENPLIGFVFSDDSGIIGKGYIGSGGERPSHWKPSHWVCIQ